jgi:hypothetical protein
VVGARRVQGDEQNVAPGIRCRGLAAPVKKCEKNNDQDDAGEKNGQHEIPRARLFRDMLLMNLGQRVLPSDFIIIFGGPEVKGPCPARNKVQIIEFRRELNSNI